MSGLGTHLACRWAPRSRTNGVDRSAGPDHSSEWLPVLLRELDLFPEAQEAVLRRIRQLAGMEETKQ
jgi:hypothetical protein